MAEGARVTGAVRVGSSMEQRDRLPALEDECEIRDLFTRCAAQCLAARDHGGCLA